jgi:lysophospholipase L1-like esterase
VEADDEYVALGSSYASGPLLGRRAPGSPWPAGRTRANYAHLVARELGLHLVDATFSGATAAQILTEGLGGEPPQIERVGPHTRLVTLTGGGNDVGFVTTLLEGTRPGRLRRLVGRRTSADEGPADPADDAAFARASDALRGIAREARRRAPDAHVVFVDYLTVLPPDPDVPTGRLPRAVADEGRRIAERLAEVTRAAAEAEGCWSIAASTASVEHHAWAPEPWTNGPGLTLRHGAPYHPRPEGMRAVADLVVRRLRA